MAHKKAAGSAKNLRDSQPKYRGVKIFGGQKALAGNIIIRQKGSKYECGQNTYVAADFTIHASIDGLVNFKKKNFKRFDGRTYLKTVVEVLPAGGAIQEKTPTPKPAVKKEDTAVEKKKTPAKKPVAKKSESSEKKPAVKKEEKTTAKKTPAKKPTVKKPKAE
ncbi:MAG: bL27 family ribosomal protein [Candidatus Peribacteria bacterium]|jgi:large subunit ribosomal protein L27|nr:bL27 family ribosomal protein [Candidatus Peribacteria bacterium]